MAPETTAAGGDAAHTVTLQIGDGADPLRITLPPGSVPPEAMLPALHEEPPQPAATPLALALDWVEMNGAADVRQGADLWMRRFVQRLSECGSQS